MNKWTRQSIKLAKQPGYLDKLHSVYPVELSPERDIDDVILDGLKRAFNGRDNAQLMKALLALDKFPIKDPYVAFFRRNPEAVDKNPDTVARITGQLYDSGFDKLLNGIREPKEVNRKIGPLFTNWLFSLDYPKVGIQNALSYEGTAIIDASEKGLLDFARSELGYISDKRPDLIIKANSRFVIGEAKFLTDYGGHQDRQLEDALKLAADISGTASKVAILDGVCWIEGKNKMFRQIADSENDVFSALLFEKYIKLI